MHIKILGPGCRNCDTLEAETRKALAKLGIDASVEKVTAFPDIVAYGIMATPGLVIDEQVVLSGRVARSQEIAQLISARNH